MGYSALRPNCCGSGTLFITNTSHLFDAAFESFAAMDSSFLAQQVNEKIGQLHGLFDEIGIPNHERDVREQEVCFFFLLRRQP